jgi:hypothetical protein
MVDPGFRLVERGDMGDNVYSQCSGFGCQQALIERFRN